MPTTDELGFEMERRVVLFKSGTVMPDGSLLGYNGNPNNIPTSNLTAGETLIKNSPIGTLYIQDNGDMWRKTTLSTNTWVLIGTGSGGGGTGSISLPASANWNDTYTLVQNSSGDWELIEPSYTSLTANSGDWSSVYNTVLGASASWSVGDLYLPVSANWDNTYTVVSASSADWDGTYTTVSTNSASWDSTYTTVSTNSADWDSAYTTVSAGSADWDSTYTTVSTNSASWDSTYTTVSSNSADWDSTYTTVSSNSADWQSTYTTVSTNSADWDNTYTTVSANSADWQSTYTTVSTNSADWQSTYTTVSTNSADWQSTYTTVSSNSADWDNTYTTVSAGSANWDSTYTTVSANSADWQSTYTTVSAGSADWDSTYTTVSAGSADWDSTYTTVSSNSADWDSTYTTVSAGSADWDSTYTTVSSNSADWDSTYTTVSSNSADWSDVYTTVNFSSADWDNTYTTVSAGSADWDSTYTTVSAGSADWTSTYTTVSANSADWDHTSADYLTSINIPQSAYWDLTYSTVTANSALWGSAQGDGSSGSGSVIAPVSYLSLTTSTTGEGINSSWSYNSSNSRYTVEFAANQPDTDYTVVTDAQSDDAIRLIVSSKTVSSFVVDARDLFGNNVQLTDGGTVLVYGSNPLIGTGNPAGGGSGGSVDLTGVSGNWESTFTTTQSNSSDWSLGATSWTTITANSASWLGSGNGVNPVGSGVGAAGAFITNVTCGTDGSRSNGITQLAEDTDEIAVSNEVPVISALVDTPTVRIHSQWEGGPSEWTGTPYVSGIPIPRSNSFTIGGGYARRFAGFVDIDLTAHIGSVVSVPFSYNGNNTSIDIEVAGLGPEILDFEVTSTPQFSQDHYKDGDDVTFVIEFDTTDVSSISLVGGDSFATGTVNDLSVTMNGVSATVTTTIDSALENITSRPFRLTAKNSLGTEGATFTSSDTVDVVSGPIVTNVSVGAYPGIQTELKLNDTVPVTFEFDTSNVDTIQTNGSSLANQSRSVTVTNLSATASFSIGNGGTANNSGGALVQFLASARKTGHHSQLGPQIESGSDFNQFLRINNQGATFGGKSVTYPVTQSALKDSETATVNCVISNQGLNPSYTFSDNSRGEVSVTDPTVYDVSGDKTVTRVGGGYNVTQANYKISVNRRENDKTTTTTGIVNIANIPPVIGVYSNSSNNSQGVRMRSGGADGTSLQSYNIRMTSDQRLNVLPTMSAPHGTLTTFSGALNGGVFNATMSVNDSDTKGTHAYTNLVAKNIANKEQNTVSTSNNSTGNYTFGGFVSRTISMSPFANQVNANVLWSTYSKVTLSWSKYPNSTFTSKPAGTTANSPDPNTIYWSVVDQTTSNTGTTPITFQILDFSKTSNNSATTTVTVEETA